MIPVNPKPVEMSGLSRVLKAEQLAGSRQAGEGSAQAHDENRHPPDVHTLEERGSCIVAHRPDLEPEGGPEQDHVHRGRCAQGDDEPRVQSHSFQQNRELCRVGHHRRLLIEGALVAPASLHQHVGEKESYDVVQHDGGKDFVDRQPGFQISGESAVRRTAGGGAEQHDDEQQRSGQTGSERVDPVGGHRPGEELAFGADAPDPCPERDDDRRRRQDQRCRPHERLDEPPPVAEGAIPQGDECLPDVGSGRPQQERANECRHRQCGDDGDALPQCGDLKATLDSIAGQGHALNSGPAIRRPRRRRSGHRP